MMSALKSVSTVPRVQLQRLEVESDNLLLDYDDDPERD